MTSNPSQTLNTKRQCFGIVVNDEDLMKWGVDSGNYEIIMAALHKYSPRIRPDVVHSSMIMNLRRRMSYIIQHLLPPRHRRNRLNWELVTDNGAAELCFAFPEECVSDDLIQQVRDGLKLNVTPAAYDAVLGRPS